MKGFTATENERVGTAFPLSLSFDAVVMLTWSDWKTELRSNRYHYATRFAQQLPVIFVQPDLPVPGYRFEATEIENITLLHIDKAYGAAQSARLHQALREKKILKPLLWIYNPLFLDFIQHQYAPVKVYHATEDYFDIASGYFSQKPDRLEKLKAVLQACHLLISVSPGVEESYLKNASYSGRHRVCPNGCDFDFYALRPPEIEAILAHEIPEKIVFYQGAINHRLNFELLARLVQELPDWQFWLCGPVGKNLPAWESFIQYPNVVYWGKLSPDDLRARAAQATVGIIPFVEDACMVKRSLPLKAFEYIASGLPVVSIPIESLQASGAFFHFAQTPEGFAAAIREAAPSRYDLAALEARQTEAKRHDYGENMAHVCTEIQAILNAPPAAKPTPLNVLILYADRTTQINAIKDYLDSYGQSSQHNIFYAVATNKVTPVVDLRSFDVVVINHSIRLCFKNHLSPAFFKALQDFGGYKVLYVQDEYDCTEVTRQAIEALGIHTVFTCVPEGSVEKVYPRERFPSVTFRSVLTGYVPSHLAANLTPLPLAKRPLLIGYRGRALSYKYGNLGREKLLIGQKMRAICEARGLPVDIEWADEKRLYGEDWVRFLGSCKTTLGTESGSNVFDETGALEAAIQQALRESPELSYEEIFDRYLAPYEGQVVMNQVSPKIFEAIAHRTALILFEGDYSGVVKPNIHYIPLKKDFSNVEALLAQVQDDALLEEMTERAYQDVIASGAYSYPHFIQDFDAFLSERILQGKGMPTSTQTVVLPPEGVPLQVLAGSPVSPAMPTRQVLLPEGIAVLRQQEAAQQKASGPWRRFRIWLQGFSSKKKR